MLHTIRNLLDLRTVRNSCRKYMTRDQSYIGIFEQFVWYLMVLKPRQEKGEMKWFLWYNSEGEPVGYGLLSIEGDKEWISGGVIPSYRRLGRGQELFSMLLKECNKTPYLEVLRSNKSAIQLYKKIGFKTIKKNKYILVMKYEK